MVLLPSQSPIAQKGEETRQILFSSVLSSQYYDELETLMFFNPQQGKLRNAVSELVERYGNPKIIQKGGLLRLQVGSPDISQTLYSFAPTGDLIGVVVYIREYKENLAIIHLAVREDYSISGCYAEQCLVLRLIQKVQEIGSRIKGIESIKILYNQSLKKIPVRHKVSHLSSNSR